jgi:hypothetical protein
MGRLFQFPPRGLPPHQPLNSLSGVVAGTALDALSQGLRVVLAGVLNALSLENGHRVSRSLSWPPQPS